MTDPENSVPLPPPAVATVPAGWYADQNSGRMRWWDGYRWTENFSGPAATSTTVIVAPGAQNGYATASLVLGIVGFFLMAIPFFIGWFFGGIPDILAIVFGIVALNRMAHLGRVGQGPAIVGIVLGGLSLLSAFIGAGTLW